MPQHTKQHLFIMVVTILIVVILGYFATFCHPDVTLDIRHLEQKK